MDAHIHNNNSSSSKIVYLDYQATTPVEKEALECMTDALNRAWGNPSSQHEAGVAAKTMVESARKWVADMIGTHPDDIIFTSGGTESNNMVLWSVVKQFNKSQHFGQDVKPHIITTNLEHDSICKLLEYFHQENIAEVSYVPASHQYGQVEVKAIVAAVKPNTCLVTVMLANNETGIIQPVKQIVEAIEELNIHRQQDDWPVIRTHTDAAQAIGKIPVSVQELGVDYLTIVGHKYYGPRNGALYVKNRSSTDSIWPMFFGGGQEKNLRSGTENTAMIAGLGKASELVCENINLYSSHMREVRDYLEEQLQLHFPSQVCINGKYEGSERIPNVCNFSFLGDKLYGHWVLSKCPHVQASVGAACHSGQTHVASPILVASGVPPEVAVNAIRLSVGRHTTKEDIDIALNDLSQAIKSCYNPNSR